MTKLNKTFLAFCLVLLVSLTSALMVGCDKTVAFTFNTNGGNSIAAVEINKGEEYTLPQPTKEGYKFEGWYLNSDFSGNAVTKYASEEDATFYAKWEQLYLLTLNTDGGTLSTQSMYLEQGANVYEAVKDLVPQKGGLTFGAWFDGNSELSKSKKMPQAALTLTAKYKVGYTVEIYVQTLDKTGYEKLEQDVVGSDYVGKTFNSEQVLTGCTEIKHADTVNSIVLTQTAENNVLKHFFNRDTYRVNFNTNYPDGLNNTSKTFEVLYGAEIEVLSDYTYEGYLLAGWATSAEGEVVYYANAMASTLQNADEEVAADSFSPSRNTTLYAVWKKGYVDMFGNADYIYLLDEEGSDIYLSRGNMFFKGDYRASTKTFFFIDSKDNILIEGRLNEDGTFMYSSDERAEYFASYYSVAGGLDEGTKIFFDKYNEITYSITDLFGTTTSKGTYYIDENGYYVATFTEGSFGGKTLYIMIGKLTTEDGSTVNAFQIRNDEEYELGQLVRFTVYQGGLTYYTAAYDIYLSGFGTASYNNGKEYVNYYYVRDGKDIYRLVNSNGSTFGVIRVMEYNGVKGYVIYDSKLEITYENENGSTLYLDGALSGVYTKADGTKLEGYYTLANSVFGGYLVNFYSGSSTYLFYATSYTETVEGGIIGGEEGSEGSEGEQTTTTVTHYTFEEKLESYAEYYYQDSKGTYYAPLIVLNDGQIGNATVYGYTESRTFVKKLTGKYTYDEKTGLYLFTVEEYLDGEVLASIVDYATVKAYVFNLAYSSSAGVNVHYWHSLTTVEGTTEYETVYTGANDASLTLIAGFAIYSANGAIVTGTYQQSGNIMAITGAQNEYVILEIDEENKTFVALESSPYTAYALKANGTPVTNEMLAFNGKGGATYTIVTTDEEGNESSTVYEGKVTKLDTTTMSDNYVYTFTGEEMNFKFIQVAYGNYMLFAIYNEEVNGEYHSATQGVLVLDGYSYYGRYIDENGQEYESIYSIPEENVVRFAIGDKYRYFDLKEVKENKTFTLRGAEYGTYLVMDNQVFESVYFALDGYGKLTVTTIVTDEEGNSETVTVCDTGAYVLSGSNYVLTYNDGNKEVTYEGALGIYNYDSYAYNVFMVSHKEVVQTYVNLKDWSVLVLDDVGNAVKYDTFGNKETGSFVIVTESILYYVNSAGTDAHIFVYDTENGTISQTVFTARSYYTQDLESLQFTKYGFAIFNGTTRYYYNRVENDIYVYHKDPEHENANKYGFVEENFGEFEDVKEYGGKTYYANEITLSFERGLEGAEKYPLTFGTETKSYLSTLSFTPGGAFEFSVTGKVYIKGLDNTYTCYVTREVNEEDEVEFYVTIPANMGYYRYDIVAQYLGYDEEGNLLSSYEVVGLSYHASAYSASALGMYYLIAMFYGQEAANAILYGYGFVYLDTVYDEAGESVSNFTGEFGQLSGLFDSKGTLISFKNVEYVTSNSVYTVQSKGEDGYDYTLSLSISRNSNMGVYEFTVLALVREETIETQDGYSVTVGRVVFSESGYPVGTVMSASVSYGGEELQASDAYTKDGSIYYVVRTKNEDGLYTNATYYVITLTEEKGSDDMGSTTPEEGGSTEEGETTEGEGEQTQTYKNPVNFYESATVSSFGVTCYYDDAGLCFIDMNEEGNITILSLNGVSHIIVSCEYDEDTGKYFITNTAGRSWYIQLVEGKIVITEPSLS